MPTDDHIRASVRRALIGNAPENLIEVRFQNGSHLVLEFVFGGPIHEEDLESASVAETEIISDLPPGITSEGRFVERSAASAELKLVVERPFPDRWPPSAE